jgi:hypothetical protein
MNSLFGRLPIEIVKTILSYDGTILKERNGKYMKQISKTDQRYEIFDRIPKKDFICASYYGSYTFVQLDGTFRLTKTEYYDVVVYLLYKNGRPFTESRYACY